MKKAWSILFLCVVFLLGTAFGEKKQPDLKAYLTQVTERGRALYAYDQAAWHGTDAFLALHPETQGLANYVCYKTDKGWLVDFGRFNPAHDKFLVIYEATETDHSGNFTANKLDTPREETGFVLAAENALLVVGPEFPREKRDYNTAVLPVPDGSLFVYVYPAQTNNTIWPLGGDVRFTLSADGKTILEKRLLHKTILDREFPAGTVAGYHTHILTDVPEDTDVLLVLARKPRIPEFIGAGKKVFSIAPDGSIAITKK